MLLRQGISDLMMGCPAALNLARFFVQRSKLHKATRSYQPLAPFSAVHGINLAKAHLIRAPLYCSGPEKS
jgi:hypothetical protein